MPLEDFIIRVFCWVDEHVNALLGDHRLRQRGFAPKLSDSEVITMEVVGEFLGLDTDVGLWKYFSHAMFDFQAIRPSNCRSERAICRLMKIPKVCANTFRAIRLVKCQVSRAQIFSK